MKLLLVCTVIVLLASNVKLKRPKSRARQSVAAAFNNPEYDIIPEIISSAPKGFLQASWLSGDVQAMLGNELSPLDLLEWPDLAYAELEPGWPYSVVIIDKDSPSAADPFWRNYLLALWMNVYDLNLSSGNEVAAYNPPSPIPGKPPHFYLMLLFKQVGYIDVSGENFTRLNIDRLVFSVKEFAANYTECLVAGNFFRAVYRECQ